MTVYEDPLPPDPAMVRRRWISPYKQAWARRADEILLQCGAVRGERTYDTYNKARWGARRLKLTMVSLDMHETWQLKEHVFRSADGFTWELEYVPPLRS
jgi:hypothetical protein